MKLLTTIILLFSLVATSQTKFDVIYANKNNIVSLYLDDPIRTAVVGNSEYFRFEYNRESFEPLGYLKAIKGPASNLKIITQNGNIYNFKIEYKEFLSIEDYFIDATLAIGNIRGQIIDSKISRSRDVVVDETNVSSKEEVVREHISQKVEENDYYTDEENIQTITYEQPLRLSGKIYQEDREKFYINRCKGLANSQGNIKRIIAGKDKVIFKVKRVTYDNDELYFTMEINNKSNVDYDVNYLEFFLNGVKSTRRSTNQRLSYKPIMIYEQPVRIPPKEIATCVYVFKKFSIGSDKHIEVELNEKKGERNFVLYIPHEIINNPS